MVTDTASVLVVDDEPDLAALYASWLEDRFNVRTASDASEALAAVEGGIDVVLFDRRIPLSAETVVDAVRERAPGCRVVLMTGTESDTGADAVETRFDDRLLKPVSKDQLRDRIERLLLRSAYDERLRELFTLATRKATLDGRKSDAEIQSSQEYAELEDRIAVLRVQVDDLRAELVEGDGYRWLCRDLTRSSSPE